MEWREILIGDESLAFLAEVAVRAAIMFILVFITLRVMGKRAVKQLSVLELLIIISLDPRRRPHALSRSGRT